MSAGRGSAALSLTCGILGVTLIFAGVTLGYLRRSLFDERSFSSRVAASLEDPRVAQFVGEHIADAAIRARPDLVGFRPVLVSLARGAVASSPFRATVRRAARTLHRSAMSGETKDIVLTLQDLGAVLQSATAAHPELARKIPKQLSAAVGRLSSIRGGAIAMRLTRFGLRLRIATLGFLAAGIALAAACVAFAAAKRRTIMRLGVALMILSFGLAIAARFGGGLMALLAHPADVAPPIAGLAGAFLGGLMAWAMVLGFTGLVLAAASASLLERVSFTLGFHRFRGWLFGDQPRMRVRLARGLVGAGVGGAFLRWPIPMMTVAAWLAGLMILYAGLREAFIAALHLLPAMERREARVREDARRAPAAAIALVAGTVVVLLAGALWLFSRSSASPPPAEDIVACNGSPLLCDRTLDRVVFPTTHNSMSGADNASWMFPNQNDGVVKQLEAGIRGFLIDVHNGNTVGDVVKTAIEDEKAAKEKYEAVIGKEGFAAAIRIRDRLQDKDLGPRDVYMCHGFCELGATKLVPVLREVREFLVSNPGEVLIFVIQDEGVAPQEIERCFRESGLVDFVYRGPAKPPWPTLRELVASDQRVLVMAENSAAGVPWFHLAFEVMQETPYKFHDASEFSNRPGRGGTSGSLLLMNHWIETGAIPKPSNAQIVNARDVLLRRARACRRERRHVPNLIAVDFYGVGDLLDVCRELNGIPPPDTSGTAPAAVSAAP